MQPPKFHTVAAHRRRARSALIAAALGLLPLSARAAIIQTTVQPSLGINFQVITFGATGDLGIVDMFAGNFAPDHFADGTLLPVSGNNSLATALGSTYGGNGVTNFALPNLNSRTIVGAGQGAGLSNQTLGATSGASTVNLSISQYPVSAGGGSQPFTNVQPSLALTYYICVSGFYAANDGSTVGVGANQNPFIGQIVASASVNALPSGNWLPANGQLLNKSQYQALALTIGTTFGGDGTNTIGLPDLRGRTVIGTGPGPGLTPRTFASTTGTETTSLALANLPAPSGTNATYSNMQPSIALNYIISLTGTFPSQSGGFDGNNASGTNLYLGQITLFAGNYVPGGWALCNGQTVSIAANSALFSLLGTTYGGNGMTTFGLPDLRGRTAVGFDNATEFPGQSTGVESLSLTNDSLILIHSPTNSTPATGASDKAIALGAVLKGADLSLLSAASVTLDKSGASATNYKATLVTALTTFPTADAATTTSTQSLAGKVYLPSTAYNAAASGTVTIQNDGSGVLDANDVFTITANIGMATPKATGDSTFSTSNALSATVAVVTNAYAGLSSKTTRSITQPVSGVNEFQNILGTEAQIFAGTPGSAKTITMNWRTRANSETVTHGTVPPLYSITHPLISDVVRILGTGTDIYVLQMEYNPADLPAGADETYDLAHGFIDLVHFDAGGSGRWIWAGLETSSYTAGPFVDLGPMGLADDLGRRGAYISGGHHYAWAVVNVEGDFAVVPEPASLGMLALGALALLRRKR